MVVDGGAVLPAEQLKAAVAEINAGPSGKPGFAAVRLDDVDEHVRGVFITSVDRGSNSAAAGTVLADVVQTVNGLKVDAGTTLAPFCEAMAAGGSSTRIAGFNRVTNRPFDRQVGDSSGRTLTPIAESVEPVPGADLYTRYTEETDVDRVLRIKVPQTWSNVDQRPTVYGPTIIASTNLDTFASGWDTPGIFFTVTRAFNRTGIDTFMNQLATRRAECTEADGVQPYDDNTFQGSYMVLTNCGGTASTYVVIVGAPVNGEEYLVGVTAQLPAERDWVALQRAIQSFRVVSRPPGG